MKRFITLSALIVFLGSVLISGCGHFKNPKKPPPGQVKKHTSSTMTDGASNS